MSRLFDLDWQLLSDSVLSIIAVIVLFFCVGYFLFDPARKMLSDRQERIKNDIDTAVHDKEEALALKEEYEAKLKNIDSEAEAILSEARKKALANEAKIVAEAKEEAARIIARANTEAELEKKKANDDVKREIVAVASMMAGKIVASSIDTTVSDGLIDETLKEMGENTWLS
jgi:F-type H+-transporting ATPase subunit b